MKKVKYLLAGFIAFLLVGAIKVNAEAYSETFRAILNSNDTITLTYNGIDYKDTLISMYMDEFNNEHDGEYYFYTDVSTCSDNYSECNIQMINRDTSDVVEEHLISINYNEVYGNEFQNILSNGSLIVNNSTLLESKLTIINNTLEKYRTDDYYFSVNNEFDCNADYSKCNVILYFQSGNQEQHVVNVEYVEEYSDDYNRFAENGEIVVTWSKNGGHNSLIYDYITNLNVDDNYSFYVQECNENYSKCDGILYNNQTNQQETHIVTIKYEEKYSDEFKKLSTDGNIIITSSTLDSKMILVSNYISKVKLSDDKYFRVNECNEDFTTCTVVLSNNMYQTLEKHLITIKYEEKYSDEFKKLTKDGNIVITSSGNKQDLVSQYAYSFRTDKINFNIGNCNEDYTICVAYMNETENNFSATTEQHVVKITYQEKYSDEFKKITTDGTLVIESITSKDFDSEFLLTAKVNDLIDTSKYIGYGSCNENYECNVVIQAIDGKLESHNVKVIIKEPSKETQNIVTNAVKNMKPLDLNQEPFDLKQGYILDDLYLINYYNSIRDINDWNYYASSKALKFSKELIQLTKGSNISFGIDLRAGDCSDLWDFAFGKAIVYYDGIAYTTVDAAVTQMHVLYIPNNIENTKEAYINAVQTRIDNYFGKNDIKVTYGGLLNDLDEYNKEYGLIDYSKTDGNYYNIKIGEKNYSFIIVKTEQDKIEDPTYIGSDIVSNISISSKEAEIPLDTSLTVTRLENERIEKAVNTNNYLAYDIKLYSNAKGANITKLSNGKFKVSIPVSESLNGKEVTTYYINDNNELIEYETTVENGVATFETDHFSVYTLVEKKNTQDDQNINNNEPGNTEENKNEITEQNPQTYDGIMTWVILGLISMGGIIGIIIYKKKYLIQ